MRAQKWMLVGGLFLVLSVVACHRRSEMELAQVRDDLNHVCRAQQNFLATRRLMKTVSERELIRERDRHFAGDVQGSLVREALAEAERAPAGTRRLPLEAAAKKAGLAAWRCPELDQL